MPILKKSEEVMTKQKVLITDVILRDAHQSLIATRLRTDDMLPGCAMLDDIGYWSLECWGGATFDACLRFLKEDPWERLSKLKAALPKTRLQMLVRGQNLLGYRHYSDDVVKAFIHKAAENGMDVFRIFDALNDVRNLRMAIEATKESGKHAQGTICYTTSPVHDVQSFVTLGKELAKLDCDSIAIKDMAGLLTPYATSELPSCECAPAPMRFSSSCIFLEASLTESILLVLTWYFAISILFSKPFLILSAIEVTAVTAKPFLEYNLHLSVLLIPVCGAYKIALKPFFS